MNQALHPRTDYLLKLASRNPTHGYLFVGQNETQKTMIAFDFFANLHRALNYDKNTIDRLKKGHHQSIIHVEPDEKNSIKLAYIKETLHSTLLRPSEDMPLRLVLISQAENMTIEAANSLLKTLEEPSDNIIYILSANNTQDLPSTIASRLQVIEFLPTNTDNYPGHEFDEAISDFLQNGLSAKFELIHDLSKNGQLSNFLDELEAKLQTKARQNPQLYNLLEKLIKTRASISHNVNARLAMELLALEMSR